MREALAVGTAPARERGPALVRAAVILRNVLKRGLSADNSAFWICVQKAGSTPASADRCCHRIEREVRPPMRCAGRRGRPPQLLLTTGRWLTAPHCASACRAL